MGAFIGASLCGQNRLRECALSGRKARAEAGAAAPA
jgi:hypothetical protein